MARRTQVEETEELTVSVVRFGGRVQHVSLEEGATVEDAVDEAGFTVKNTDEVSVNGDVLDKSDLADVEVSDGDRIVLTPKFEGGMK